MADPRSILAEKVTKAFAEQLQRLIDKVEARHGRAAADNLRTLYPPTQENAKKMLTMVMSPEANIDIIEKFGRSISDPKFIDIIVENPKSLGPGLSMGHMDFYEEVVQAHGKYRKNPEAYWNAPGNERRYTKDIPTHEILYEKYKGKAPVVGGSPADPAWKESARSSDGQQVFRLPVTDAPLGKAMIAELKSQGIAANIVSKGLQNIVEIQPESMNAFRKLRAPQPQAPAVHVALLPGAPWEQATRSSDNGKVLRLPMEDGREAFVAELQQKGIEARLILKGKKMVEIEPESVEAFNKLREQQNPPRKNGVEVQPKSAEKLTNVNRGDPYSQLKFSGSDKRFSSLDKLNSAGLEKAHNTEKTESALSKLNKGVVLKPQTESATARTDFLHYDPVSDAIISDSVIRQSRLKGTIPLDDPAKLTPEDRAAVERIAKRMGASDPYKRLTQEQAQAAAKQMLAKLPANDPIVQMAMRNQNVEIVVVPGKTVNAYLGRTHADARNRSLEPAPGSKEANTTAAGFMGFCSEENGHPVLYIAADSSDPIGTLRHELNHHGVKKTYNSPTFTPFQQSYENGRYIGDGSTRNKLYFAVIEDAMRSLHDKATAAGDPRTGKEIFAEKLGMPAYENSAYYFESIVQVQDLISAGQWDASMEKDFGGLRRFVEDVINKDAEMRLKSEELPELSAEQMDRVRKGKPFASAEAYKEALGSMPEKQRANMMGEYENYVDFARKLIAAPAESREKLLNTPEGKQFIQSQPLVDALHEHTPTGEDISKVALKAAKKIDAMNTEASHTQGSAGLGKIGRTMLIWSAIDTVKNWDQLFKDPLKATETVVSLGGGGAGEAAKIAEALEASRLRAGRPAGNLPAVGKIANGAFTLTTPLMIKAGVEEMVNAKNRTSNITASKDVLHGGAVAFAGTEALGSSALRAVSKTAATKIASSAAGRAVPVVGEVLLMYDAGNLISRGLLNGLDAVGIIKIPQGATTDMFENIEIITRINKETAEGKDKLYAEGRSDFNPAVEEVPHPRDYKNLANGMEIMYRELYKEGKIKEIPSYRDIMNGAVDPDRIADDMTRIMKEKADPYYKLALEHPNHAAYLIDNDKVNERLKNMEPDARTMSAALGDFLDYRKRYRASKGLQESDPKTFEFKKSISELANMYPTAKGATVLIKHQDDIRKALENDPMLIADVTEILQFQKNAASDKKNPLPDGKTRITPVMTEKVDAIFNRRKQAELQEIVKKLEDKSAVLDDPAAEVQRRRKIVEDHFKANEEKFRMLGMNELGDTQFTTSGMSQHMFLTNWKQFSATLAMARDEEGKLLNISLEKDLGLLNATPLASKYPSTTSYDIDSFRDPVKDKLYEYQIPGELGYITDKNDKNYGAAWANIVYTHPSGEKVKKRLVYRTEGDQTKVLAFYDPQLPEAGQGVSDWLKDVKLPAINPPYNWDGIPVGESPSKVIGALLWTEDMASGTPEVKREVELRTKKAADAIAAIEAEKKAALAQTKQFAGEVKAANHSIIKGMYAEKKESVQIKAVRNPKGKATGVKLVMSGKRGYDFDQPLNMTEWLQNNPKGTAEAFLKEEREYSNVSTIKRMLNQLQLKMERESTEPFPDYKTNRRSDIEYTDTSVADDGTGKNRRYSNEFTLELDHTNPEHRKALALLMPEEVYNQIMPEDVLRDAPYPGSNAAPAQITPEVKALVDQVKAGNISAETFDTDHNGMLDDKEKANLILVRDAIKADPTLGDALKKLNVILSGGDAIARQSVGKPQANMPVAPQDPAAIKR